MLGNDDADILGRSGQHVIQVFELCTVVHLSVEGKFVGDLQRSRQSRSKWLRKSYDRNGSTESKAAAICERNVATSVRPRVVMGYASFRPPILPIADRSCVPT